MPKNLDLAISECVSLREKYRGDAVEIVYTRDHSDEFDIYVETLETNEEEAEREAREAEIEAENVRQRAHEKELRKKSYCKAVTLLKNQLAALEYAQAKFDSE